MMGSLGLVTVTAAGTPVRLTANRPTPTERLGAQSVRITPKPANAGVIYVGTSGMVVATGVGVLGAIPKPTSATTGPFDVFEIKQELLPAGLNLAELYLDAASNGDGAYVAYTQG